jgi:hypothetical protein
MSARCINALGDGTACVLTGLAEGRAGDLNRKAGAACGLHGKTRKTRTGAAVGGCGVCSWELGGG